MHEPRLRFREFKDGWKKETFGKVFSQFSEYVDPTKENLELWSLTVNAGLTPKSKRYNRSFLVKKSDKFKLVKNNYVVYNPMNMTLGSIDINKHFKIAVSGYYVVMKINKGYDENFSFELMKTNKMILKYKRFATGSLMEKQRVQFNTLSLIKSYFPSLYEQKEIGLLLTNLDNQIELQSDKLEVLKNSKEGYLKKMFPSGDSDTPLFRFKGFNDEWKQTKLKDIAKFNPKSNVDDNFNYVDLESILGTSLVKYRKEKKSSAPSRAQRVAKNGDIFYQTVRPYQKNNYYFDLNSNEQFVFSSGYTQIRTEEVNGYMLFSLMQKNDFVKKVINLCTGTSFPAISFKDLSNIYVYVPDDLEEQRKIGSLFKNIDKQIELQERRVNELKNQKKAYLQKMFI